MTSTAGAYARGANSSDDADLWSLVGELLDDMLGWADALVGAPAAPSRPARGKITALVAGPTRLSSTLLVVFLVADLLWLPAVAPTLKVRVDGHPLVLHASSPTVLDALQRGGLRPIDGVLISAVSHRVIDAHFAPAVVRKGSHRVALSSPLKSGDALVLRNGSNEVEPTMHERVPVAGSGLPDIEYTLWAPPRPGLNDRLVGARSDEVVGETIITPPAPAAAVPGNVVALTFDDGPNPDSTPAILAILRAANIKATFCIVGYAATHYPQLVRQIHDEGHTLCDHTAHHVMGLGTKSPDVITAEIRDDADIIEKAAGVRPLFFRAPGGTWAPNLIAEVHRQDMRALGWAVDPADYKRPGAAVITARILAQLRPGAVILMHDGGGDRSQTVAQLAGLIDHLRALGYTFAVPQAAA
jgi:peptidoglycan/xylan/chitin deacetylase (PgdA/CDA1 family)